MNCGTSAPGDFELVWIKSSYSSNGNEGDCVEVAAAPAAVLVRDSKDAQGPLLAFAEHAWADFTSYTAKG
ncbi:DUF397 domain-containing protein [Streptomyces drozdowiczii]|uniref:DUF397 domain-containing protein n=1 Tax=Streptomyces drozdowiczii TaxID=202862 RepID=A0ABY6PVI1_9ACTN|nr:DUF397 domain-containing protein [Streptomyces drozdowiczii]MCX0244194.1 DUF397 domain-containing protein [Streptomyces drozdowiczii]UZK55997.1 DUF397 domain-containing protein [Streptomyces drozdowiczii]